MKLWISRIFLFTELTLLLFHNLASHHHDDDHDDPTEHHNNDTLEHVQIDHVFSSQVYHFDGLQAIVAELIIQPEHSFIQFPLTLHVQPVILPVSLP
jgi:hypothetical protein